MGRRDCETTLRPRWCSELVPGAGSERLSTSQLRRLPEGRSAPRRGTNVSDCGSLSADRGDALRSHVTRTTKGPHDPFDA